MATSPTLPDLTEVAVDEFTFVGFGIEERPMNLPWWGWALISGVGFAGVTLTTAKLSKAGLSNPLINICVFAVGLLLFVPYGLASGENLRLPIRYFGWMLPLGVSLFIANYAFVAALRDAANGGYVKATYGAVETVLVTAVVAGVSWWRVQAVELAWWKVLGIALCVLGGSLVAYEKPCENTSESTFAPARGR